MNTKNKTNERRIILNIRKKKIKIKPIYSSCENTKYKKNYLCIYYQL